MNKNQGPEETKRESFFLPTDGTCLGRDHLGMEKIEMIKMRKGESYAGPEHQTKKGSDAA